MQTQTMANAAVLNLHSIKTRVNRANGHLEAWDVVTGPQREDLSTWTDVHNLTTKQLYAWLGY